MARSMAASLEVTNKKPTFLFKSDNFHSLLVREQLLLQTLSRAGKVQVVTVAPEGCISNVKGDLEVYLELN